MQNDNFLRHHFKPMQPSIHPFDSQVNYHEIMPNLALQPYIYCYWQLKTDQTLTEPFIYRVVADGCIDIFFDLNQPQISFAMGFSHHYTEFPLEQEFNFVGIRFFPSMFSRFMRIDASELTDRYANLEDIDAPFAKHIETMANESSALSPIIEALDQFLINKLNSISFESDSRFNNALYRLIENVGSIEIEKDLDTGLSARQLRRKFKEAVGTSPKTFSKVLRFQKILNAKPSSQSLKENKIYYDHGYYDQSHFIKEFKNFYGVTPKDAFQK